MDILDYLIVGQGLAGSLVAYRLRRRGRSVMVVDATDRSRATDVAAGLINPVTGKRLVKTEGVAACLAEALRLYREMGRHYQTKFFYPRDTLRLFRNPQEMEAYAIRAADPAYQPYLGPLLGARDVPRDLQASLGGFVIKGSGHLNMGKLAALVRMELKHHHALREKVFKLEDCTRLDPDIEWRGLHAKRLIFCEGYSGADNPLFDFIPYTPVRGELLSLTIDRLAVDWIINKGLFLLPLGQGQFKAGSTYDWDNLGPRPTEKGREELEGRIRATIHNPFTITGHWSGIRPIIRRRYPVAGRHPDHPQVAILNGLGSRGALFAPYFSGQLVDHLETDAPIDTAAAIDTHHWMPPNA